MRSSYNKIAAMVQAISEDGPWSTGPYLRLLSSQIPSPCTCFGDAEAEANMEGINTSKVINT